MSKLQFYFAVVALVLAGSAEAGEVTLKSGQVLKGFVTVQKQQLCIENKLGSMKISLDQVEHWHNTKLENQFIAKQKQCNQQSIPELLSLADWAETKYLKLQAKSIYRRLLELDSNHAKARQKLGFKRLHGDWVKAEEYYKSQGLVNFQGRWVTREVAKAEAQKNLKRTAQRTREREQKKLERSVAKKKRLAIAKIKRKRRGPNVEYDVPFGIIPGRDMRRSRRVPGSGIQLLRPR